MADCTGVISQLFIYPVKSCAGIEISEAQLTPAGLAMDREWMIVDQAGQFLTQRQCPHMVWISPSISDQALTLSAPNVLPIRIPLNFRGKPLEVTVWRDTLIADDMGDEVSKWLDAFLAIPGKQLRLVRFSKTSSRLSSAEWTQGMPAQNKFSDGFALLVVSQSALDEFNARLQSKGYAPVDINRFRPNIVLEGPQAHEEDHFDTITIHNAHGPILLKPVKPCPRCPIPDINPYTASSSPEVSETLAEYRAIPLLNGAICFGMNTIIQAGEGLNLHTGQPFEANFKL